MAKYIPWYVVELERRLANRIGEERLFMVTSEVQDHLESKADELVAAGMEPTLAERAAVNGFGSADDVADGILEATTAFAKRRAGVVLSLAGALCIAGTSAAVAFFGFDPGLVGGLILVGVPLAAVALCVGAALVRHTLTPVLAAIGMAGTLACVALVPFGYTQRGWTTESRFWVQNDLVQARRKEEVLRIAIDRLNMGLTYYRALKAAHGNLKAVPGRPIMVNGAYFALPTAWGYSPTQLGAPSIPASLATFGDEQPDRDQYTSDVSAAMASWLLRGPAYLRDTVRQLDFARAEVKMLEAGASRPPRLTPILALTATLGGVGVTVAVLLVHGAFFRLAKRWRRRRRGRLLALA